MSYISGFGDPITSPDQVDPTLPTPTTSTVTTAPTTAVTTAVMATPTPITADTGSSGILLLGGLALVAYFVFKKR